MFATNGAPGLTTNGAIGRYERGYSARWPEHPLHRADVKFPLQDAGRGSSTAGGFLAGEPGDEELRLLCSGQFFAIIAPY